MVGCRVSLAVMYSLPGLWYIHLVTNLPSDLWRGQPAHSAHCEGPGEELIHPKHWLPSSKGKQDRPA